MMKVTGKTVVLNIFWKEDCPGQKGPHWIALAGDTLFSFMAYRLKAHHCNGLPE